MVYPLNVKSNQFKNSGFSAIESIIASAILLAVLVMSFKTFSIIFSAQSDVVKSADLLSIGQYLHSHIDCIETLKEWDHCEEKKYIQTLSDSGDTITSATGTKIQNFDIKAFCENREIGFEYKENIWGWQVLPTRKHCRSHLELQINFDSSPAIRDVSQNDFPVHYRAGIGPRNSDYTFNKYQTSTPRLGAGVSGKSIVLNGSRGEHLVIPHHDNFLSDEFSIMMWVKLYPMSWNPTPATSHIQHKYDNRRMWSLFTKDHNQIENSGHIWLKFFQKNSNEKLAYITARYQNEIDLKQFSSFLGNIPDVRQQGSNISIPLNEWKHVALTSNDKELSLYIDGRKVMSQVPDFESIQDKGESNFGIPKTLRFSGTQDLSCFNPVCASKPLNQCNRDPRCIYSQGVCGSYCFGNREPIVIGSNNHRNFVEKKADYGPKVGDQNNLYLDEFFDGEIDQISFWSRSLSDEEISTIFRNRSI